MKLDPDVLNASDVLYRPGLQSVVSTQFMETKKEEMGHMKHLSTE